MDKNKLTYTDTGQLILTMNNMFVDVTSLFNLSYSAINIESKIIEPVTFNFTVQPSEDMKDVIICVANSVESSNKYVKVISVEELSQIVSQALASGKFVTNVPDMHQYLKHLADCMYDKFLKDRYIILDNLFANSNSLLLKNGTPMLAVGRCVDEKTKFYSVSETSDVLGDVHIYTNLNNIDSYHTFYENLYYDLRGIDPVTKRGAGDAATSFYEFVFYSNDYDKVLVINAGCDDNSFYVKSIDVVEDYMGLREQVLSNFNDLPEVLEIAVDITNNNSSSDLLDFLDD